ncbi:hypothetical protein WM019_03505 [Bifidobacterium mongoliense]|uniref:hypothetical protein n=1 Tax=Bifidobacterium mongoliense TaxID=518643 RepID=UPI0030EE0442
MAELEIAESVDDPFLVTPWAGPLVVLGARGYRFASDSDKLDSNEQLFIAVTVPIRNFAATLIAAGWMMTAFAPRRRPVEMGIQSIPEGSMVRMVTDHYVISDRFHGFDGSKVRVGASQFRVRSIRAISIVEESSLETRQSIPSPPTFGPFAYKIEDDAGWFSYLCEPPQGLTLVGSKTLLQDDLNARVNTVGHIPTATCLRQVVLPESVNASARAVGLISPSELPDDPDNSSVCRAAILDGASAIKAVDLIDCPLVFGVLDRSVLDDTAAEFVVQRRNTRGIPVNPKMDLGWQPPCGVEIIAFKVRR